MALSKWLLGALGIMVPLAGCGSAPTQADGPLDPGSFSLVLLRTGEQPDAGTEELFAGHFAHMQSMAEAGHLLVAGPFGGERNPADLRGIFLLDEADTARARALAEEDPTTKAGVFRQEVLPITTLNVIRALPRLETERQRAREAAGEDMERPDIRPYCILIAPDGQRAAGEILNQPSIVTSVLLMGRLGAPREDQLFAIVDISTAAEARKRLSLAGATEDDVWVSEWYGSPTIAQLAWEGPGDPDGAEEVTALPSR